MATLHINIGSNSGDRKALISLAVAAIVDTFTESGGVVRESAPMESEAWGYESANRYINVGIRLDLPIETLSAVEIDGLFMQLQQIEHNISTIPHRNTDGTYKDRELDIDLIAVDEMMLTTPCGLVIPHPRMAQRAFVLQPLAELAPEWRHPATHLTVIEMLSQLL